MKAHRTNDTQIAVFCPGCKNAHVLDQRWTFNGDFERPAFSPSFLAWHDAQAEDNIPAYRCHSFIAAGRIQFLGDCTHALAGQTVDLPDWHGYDPDRYSVKEI